jgi:AcrR family transcriptional regulator
MSTVKAPRQRRSLATLNRLLDATEELLNERVLEEITVADIVARAGSSVGSFYARFPTKDALVIELLERFHRHAVAEIAGLSESEEWTSRDLESRARAYIERVVDISRRRRGLLRLRLRRRITPGAVVLPDDSERGVQLVDSLRRLFAGLDDEIAHADKDRALDFALRIIDSVASSAILVDVTSKAFGTVRDEELVEQLESVVTGYLRASSPQLR